MKYIVLLTLLAGHVGYSYDSPILDGPQETKQMDYVKPIIELTETNVITYEDIRFTAIFHCKRAFYQDIKQEIIDDLIKIEKKFNVPVELRGLLLAAACHESGYNPNAAGDRKFSKNKKKPMAIGILQQWPWWENKKFGYGINRTDYKQAAEAWMLHIVKQIPKVKSSCGYKTQKRIWIAAWVKAIRAPKAEGRCREVPTHLKVLKRWHKRIIADRESDVSGC
jgi:hypothetical protein